MTYGRSSFHGKNCILPSSKNINFPLLTLPDPTLSCFLSATPPWASRFQILQPVRYNGLQVQMGCFLKKKTGPALQQDIDEGCWQAVTTGTPGPWAPTVPPASFEGCRNNSKDLLYLRSFIALLICVLLTFFPCLVRSTLNSDD